MTNPIHPTAIIHPTAQLGQDVEVGPYTVIGPHVTIGDRSKVLAHVVIESYTTLGTDCHISSGAVIGGIPQDHSFIEQPSWVRIGNHVQIREFVTIHRAVGLDAETRVGDHSMLMAYTHLAHNVVLENNVTVANMSQLAGYVHVGDYAFISTNVLVHQHCRIGRMAIMGGASGCRQDVPPFSMNDARPSHVTGINTVGLRRRGLKPEERQRIRKAFYYLFFAGLNQAQGLQAIQENIAPDPYIDQLIAFVLSSKRGISHTRDASKLAESGFSLEESDDAEPVGV